MWEKICEPDNLIKAINSHLLYYASQCSFAPETDYSTPLQKLIVYCWITPMQQNTAFKNYPNLFKCFLMVAL